MQTLRDLSKKRPFIIILALALLVASAGLVTAMVQPSAADLLTESLELMETVESGHAIVEVAADLPEQEAMSATVEVWGQMDAGPDGEPAMRLEVLAASKAELEGMVAVSDGAQFWIYNPAENKVLTGTADAFAETMKEQMQEHEGEMPHRPQSDPADMPEAPETPEEAVARLLEYFNAERNGTDDTPAGEAYHLRLIPIPEQMPEEVRMAGGLLHVWVRTADRAPLAVAYTDGAAGAGEARATLAEINVDLDPALFTFEIPEGAEVVDVADLQPQSLSLDEAEATAVFDVLRPAELPNAARLLEVVEVGDAIVQRYNLPDGSFTVAQGEATSEMTPPAAAESSQMVTVRGVEGTLYADEGGSRTLLTWTEDDVSFWIGGDLTPEQALAVAESLN
jgi:outer membrane lipoprotein-sorting protein